MAWTISIGDRALSNLRKLDQTIQREITDYLQNRIATAENPRDFGKALRKRMFGFWRYRVRDYRIICRIKDRELIVLVVEIGHRSTIYDD